MQEPSQPLINMEIPTFAIAVYPLVLPCSPLNGALALRRAMRRLASCLILLISILQTAVTSNSRSISSVSRGVRRIHIVSWNCHSCRMTVVAARIDSKMYGFPKYTGKLTYSAYIVFALATGVIHLIGQRKTDAAGR